MLQEVLSEIHDSDVLLIGLDETIVTNTSPIHIEAAVRAHKKININLPLDRAVSLYKDTHYLNEGWYFRMAEGNNLFEKTSNALRISDIFTDVVSSLIGEDLPDPKLQSGAKEFLQLAYDKFGPERIACVTCVPTELAELLLSKVNIRSYFGAIVGCEALVDARGARLTKESPQIWELARKKLDKKSSNMTIADTDSKAACFALSSYHVSNFIAMCPNLSMIPQKNDAKFFCVRKVGEWTNLRREGRGY